ncbi:MAG: hypothetical protein ACOCTQ_04535 [Planctomycetota bacterium]
MKVFFGDAIEEMLSELRARGIDTVRIHALSERDESNLRITVHVTTLCGGQIYEGVKETIHRMDIPEDTEQEKFIREARSEEREKVVKRFQGFEMRKGILQE